ncbi:unnamed protein product [Lymnaea stagnalis]|uniref:Death domain-containing protein n=1 Tax=Lymnaea stagnalis TaxID=6523 RepID=A0AAV2HVK1_LYMST
MKEDKHSNATSNNSDKSHGKPRSERTSRHKPILQTIQEVRRKVKAFKKSHLGGSSRFNFSACSQCLEEILESWNMAAEKVKNFDVFLKQTLRKEIDEEVVASDEYIDLIALSKRGQEFENVASDSKRQLLNCIDKHVLKACASLKDMSGSDVLLCVEEYDKAVANYISGIEAKWEELESNLNAYRDTVTPFKNYVGQGEAHTSGMNKVCNNLLEVCKLIDGWVKEDEAYVDKLEEECESNKKVKENLHVTLEEHETKKKDNLEHMDKLQKRETRSLRGYTNHRQTKHKLQTKQALLEERKERLANKVERKRNDREDPKKPEKGAKSPRRADEKKQDDEARDAEMSRLEADQRDTDKELKKVKRSLKAANDRTYEHKVEAVTYRHQREELQRDNVKLDEEVSSVNDRIASIDSQNKALMRIRDMKISEEAFRKNLRDKQRQEAAQSAGSLHIVEACQYAAPSIGKHWKKVYFQLPFTPLREESKREKDAELLDYIAGKNDVTDGELALKSLTKWRTFHRKASVDDLVLALKEVKITRLANDIQTKFGERAL